jgi:3-hydroxyisobutyrate dehydrogenase
LADSTYAQVKGRAMIDGDFVTAFGVDGAVKDSELVVAALGAVGADDRLMRVLHSLYLTAEERGEGAEDMAAVIRAF